MSPRNGVDRFCPLHLALRGKSAQGFTLIELMLAVAILGVLSALASMSYASYQLKAQIAGATTDLSDISLRIRGVQNEGLPLPPTLASMRVEHLNDPWGRPYQYLVHATSPPGGYRKDRFLVPVNSDYDVYSLGVDGESSPPFTAKHSRDDIVRANDGQFIGVASDY